MDYAAQAVGLVAAGFCILSFQFRTNRGTFIFQMCGALLFSVNMFMLGAPCGGVMNAIAFLRGIFLTWPNKKGINRVTLAIIMGLIIASSVWQYAAGNLTRAADYALIIQFIVGTRFCWQQDGRMLRLCQLFLISPVCLWYNIEYLAIGGIITEVINILSVVISLLRYGWHGFEQRSGLTAGKEENTGV